MTRGERMNDDSRSDKQERRRHLANKEGRCPYCSPHGGENTTRSKRGAKKPRKKNHRSKR